MNKMNINFFTLLNVLRTIFALQKLFNRVQILIVVSLL